MGVDYYNYLLYGFSGNFERLPKKYVYTLKEESEILFEDNSVVTSFFDEGGDLICFGAEDATCNTTEILFIPEFKQNMAINWINKLKMKDKPRRFVYLHCSY